MSTSTAPTYQGQFGEFTITEHDRREVMIYRGGLLMSSLCFAIGVTLSFAGLITSESAWILTWLYAIGVMALGISLWFIHIYLVPLHRTLQVFWGIGAVTSVAIALAYPEPLWITVKEQPLTILGIGFVAASLTGIFFKEAFCFNRFETKFLTPIVPVLLLGHLVGFLSATLEQSLVVAWAVLFVIFALRKTVQAIPDDIGDKSVFAYLKGRRNAPQSAEA
jgi:uncharacterized integral membrane protein